MLQYTFRKHIDHDPLSKVVNQLRILTADINKKGGESKSKTLLGVGQKGPKL